MARADVDEAEEFRSAIEAARESLANGEGNQATRFLVEAARLGKKKRRVGWLKEVAEAYSSLNPAMARATAKDALRIAWESNGKSLPKDDYTITLMIGLAHLFNDLGVDKSFAAEALEIAQSLDTSGRRWAEIESKRGHLEITSEPLAQRQGNEPREDVRPGLPSVTPLPPKADDAPANAITNERREPSQTSLGSYNGRLNLPEISAFVSSHRQNSPLSAEAARVQDEAEDYLGSIGLGLAEALTLSSIDAALRSQQARLELIQQMSEYLRGLHGFLRSDRLQSCRALEGGATGPRSLDDTVSRAGDDFSRAVEVFEAELAFVVADSSLDTLPISTDTRRKRERSLPDLDLLSEQSSAAGRADRFRVRRLSFDPLPSIFGRASRPRWLNDVVEDAVKIHDRRQPKDAGEALEEENRTMQRLGAALFDVNLVRFGLDHGNSLRRSERSLISRFRDITACAQGLRPRVESSASRIENAQEILSALRRLRQAVAQVEERPDYLAAVLDWDKDAPVDLSDAAAKAELTSDLEQMVRELRTQVRLRRTVWSQLKRQADLAARLGPR